MPGKLYRDNDADILRSYGQEVNVRFAEEGERWELLLTNLRSALEDLATLGDPNAMAEMLELLRAMTGEMNTSLEEVEELVEREYGRRGGYSKFIVRTEPGVQQ